MASYNQGVDSSKFPANAHMAMNAACVSPEPGNPKLQKYVINENMTQQAYLGMPQTASLVATSDSGHKVHNTENVYPLSSLTEHEHNHTEILKYLQDE